MDGRFVTRRQVIAGMLAGGAGLALAACGAGGAAAPSGASAGPGSGAAYPAGGSSVAAGSWDELLTAAKKEGKVVVNGPPDPGAREKLPAGFKAAFGIEMEFLGGNSSQLAARIQSERAANQYTMDASVSGSDTMYDTFLKSGWLQPFKDSLVMPGVADGSKWKAGSPWFRDPNKDTVLQVFNTVTPTITLNTGILALSDIPNGDALLDPKWKGKICAYDPSVNGAGIAIASALYVAKGEDFVTKLYKGQNVVLSRDYQQVADWVANGSYPIGLAATYNFFEKYLKAGIKIEQPELPDAPSSVGGGFGDVAVWNHAPHPNAALVFANWIASKDGLAVYAPTQFQTPARSDVDTNWLPPQLIPKPGVKYLDTYDYDFEEGQRIKIRDFFNKLLK